MSRPRSEDKRHAIMAAATRVIALQGLGAATATIAQEAGVANGSLFTYFETKTELLNQLYIELKVEMTKVTFQGASENAPPREQLWHIWVNWMQWAMANPEKRRVLTYLTVYDAITPTTRAKIDQTMLKGNALLENIRANGPMKDVVMTFMFEITNALADTTMNFISNDPANSEMYTKIGFEALWRAIT